MSIGVLTWSNENALNPYPLTKGFGYDSFLIDANFIQFDSFVPILQSVKVVDDIVTITIQFDLETLAIELNKSFFSTAGVVHKIYSGGRYLGKLVFGADASRLVETEIANLDTKIVNIPFLSHLVKSIPSTAGVYSIAGTYGAVKFESDDYVWYDVNSNDVTFNAVSGFDYGNDSYLKTLNEVAPVANSVYIKDSEVIKITSAGNSAIEISMVGTDVSGLLKAQDIIVTNG